MNASRVTRIMLRVVVAWMVFATLQAIYFSVRGVRIEGPDPIVLVPFTLAIGLASWFVSKRV